MRAAVSSMTTEQLLDRFDLPDFTPAENTWTVIHEGLAEAIRSSSTRRSNGLFALGSTSGALGRTSSTIWWKSG